MIASPFYEQKGYCAIDYFVNIAKMVHPNKQYFFVDTSKTKDFMVSLKDYLSDEGLNFPMEHIPYTDTTRKRQMIAYNLILKRFLESDCTHLFVVESDVFPHKYTLQLLLEHNKPVVSATYWLGLEGQQKMLCWTNQAFNCVTKRGEKKSTFSSNFEKPEHVDGKLRSVKGGCGFGCCLIKREVIEKLPKMRIGALHADTYFHEDLQFMGIPRYIDTRIVCEHQPSAYPEGDF